MFNLEQAISEWRRKMSAGGIKTRAILDELESHLREDAEKLAEPGMLSETEAFMVAASRIGQSDLLRAEFAKIDPLREARFVKMIGMGCGTFAILITLWGAPSLLFDPGLSALDRVLGWTPVVLTLLSVISWRFSYKFLPVIRSHPARVIAGFVCGLASLGCIYVLGLLLANVIVPRISGHFIPEAGRPTHVPSGVELSQLFFIGISVLWGVAVAAVPGAIAYGLEEAARRRMKENTYV